MPDPYTSFVLCLAAIAWCAWGLGVGIELLPYAPSWQWQAFLIAAAGPCVWCISAWRGLLRARHAVLHHFGVDKCGCHHDGA